MIAHLDLFAGSDRGRIYKISQIGRISPIGRISLDSDNGWARDTAQRLLIEQNATWSTETLSERPEVAVQQLWTMHTLGTLKAAHVLSALKSASAAVREHTVRLAEHFLNDEKVLQSLHALVSDENARVRVQLAFSLGSADDETLAKLVARDPADKNILIAALSSSPNHAEAARWQAALKSPAAKASVKAPVITNHNPDRAKVVAAYAGVSKLRGDAAKGRTLYLAACSACHRLKNEGNELGPDLSTVAAKPDEQLLEAILDPNRAVEQRYLTHTLRTKDGKEHIGMLAEETANSVTLKLAGATEVILRTDIEKQTTGTRTLMPEGLESVLKPQDVADILAWMRAK
jgi:putative heme-binding domain-containing protein